MSSSQREARRQVGKGWEAAQLASGSGLRLGSRVGLCGVAARQGAVWPRFHMLILLLCTPGGVQSHGAQVHLTPSFSTEKPNGRGASGDGGLDTAFLTCGGAW